MSKKWAKEIWSENRSLKVSVNDNVTGVVALQDCSSLFPQSHCLFSSCQNVTANPRPTAQDLAGFWDLLQLSIEDISLKFDELYHLKSNDWQPVPSGAAQSSPERKVLPTHAAQCPGWGRKAAETGLSPPTTTTISLPLFFNPVPAWDELLTRPPCPTQRGPRDPSRHAWEKSHLKEGWGCCVFKV